MHRLSPEAKLVAVVAVVVVIAMTPRRETVAFALYALGAWAIIATTKIGLLTYLKRLSVIIPFVMFALIVPFIGGGESVHVLGVSLSVDGLWATWNILAKAGLGATMSIALSATTPVPELLHGMTRLKVPRLLVAIVAFMLRYIDVLVEQLGRMRRSMVARGHDPRWLWQVKPIASSAGALFVRSYERGERVHQAMLARGYTGVMPTVSEQRASTKEWLAVLLCTFGAALVLTVAVV
ncbi:MAG: cobalt ECF transporter T component CbiQ [Actinomycetota bacterium]|nr:cobalt ECF transporter T component CbiQ [Actinomycetota bacterium]